MDRGGDNGVSGLICLAFLGGLIAGLYELLRDRGKL